MGASEVRLSIAEAAVKAGKSTATIQTWLRRGHIHAVRVGWRVFVLNSSLERFLAGTPAKHAAAPDSLTAAK